MIAEENIKLKMDISSVIHKKCVIYEAVMDNCCVINKGGKIMMGI